jgi:hypothetical protein
MNLSYITKTETLNTGGGCFVDILYLEDGRVLILNDEILTLYNSFAEWIDSGGEISPIDTIDLTTKPGLCRCGKPDSLCNC